MEGTSCDAPLEGGGHDHDLCIARALADAEALCARRGVRLTVLRRRILELVWSDHSPVRAYDLLQRLSAEHAGAAPATVYRALDFLLDQGLVHRIESMNAFIGCARPAENHGGQFLICRACGDAVEIDHGPIDHAIERGAADLGFTVEERTIELRGLCVHCGPADGESAE